MNTFITLNSLTNESLLDQCLTALSEQGLTVENIYACRVIHSNVALSKDAPVSYGITYNEPVAPVPVIPQENGVLVLVVSRE